MTNPALHPFAELYPLLDEKELSLLADNVRQNGLLNPIVLLDGKILDGRNRFEACKLAGVEPRFIDYAFDTDPILWVLAQNSALRNLNSSQKACVAVDAEPFLDKLLAEAKERQRLGKQKIADPQTKGRAVDKLALYFSTNAEYIRKAKQIKEKSAQRFADIKSGAISIPAVYTPMFEPNKPSPFANTDGSWSDLKNEREAEQEKNSSYWDRYAARDTETEPQQRAAREQISVMFYVVRRKSDGAFLFGNSTELWFSTEHHAGEATGIALQDALRFETPESDFVPREKIGRKVITYKPEEFEWVKVEAAYRLTVVIASEEAA